MQSLGRANLHFSPGTPFIQGVLSYGVKPPWRVLTARPIVLAMTEGSNSSFERDAEIARMRTLADTLDEAELDAEDREALSLMNKALRIRRKISELKGERLPTSDPSFLRSVLRTVVKRVQPQHAH